MDWRMVAKLAAVRRTSTDGPDAMSAVKRHTTEAAPRIPKGLAIAYSSNLYDVYDLMVDGKLHMRWRCHAGTKRLVNFVEYPFKAQLNADGFPWLRNLGPNKDRRA